MATHRLPLSPCQVKKLSTSNNEDLKHVLGQTPKIMKSHLGASSGTKERANLHVSAVFSGFEDMTHWENLIKALAAPRINLCFTPCQHGAIVS